jgi:hypothetical protein
VIARFERTASRRSRVRGLAGQCRIRQVVTDGAREGRTLEQVGGALDVALHVDAHQLIGRLRIGPGGASTSPDFNSWWRTLVMVQYLVVLRNPEIATTRRFLVARRGGSDADVEGTGGRDTSVPSLHEPARPAAGPGKVRGARFRSASDGAAAAGEDSHHRASAAAAVLGHLSETAVSSHDRAGRSPQRSRR